MLAIPRLFVYSIRANAKQRRKGKKRNQETSGLSEVWYRAWFGRLTDSYKAVKISNAKPVGTLSKSLFTPLIFRPLSGSMTTYLTTIGTKIFLRAISNNQISGCGPVGRALDLGSRCREFESPHSDQKSADLEQNQPVFYLLFPLVEEI